MNNHNKNIICIYFTALAIIFLSCQRDLNNPYLDSDYNTPPVARFTVIKTTGTIDTMFYVDASSSGDAEDDVFDLRVRWDWENNGAWDTDWHFSKTDSHRYDAAGVKQIALVVMDGKGLLDTAYYNVTIANTTPVASFMVTDGVPAGTHRHGQRWHLGGPLDIE